MDLDVKMKAVMLGACFLIVSVIACHTGSWLIIYTFIAEFYVLSTKAELTALLCI